MWQKIKKWYYEIKKNVTWFLGDIEIFAQPFWLILWGDHHYKIKGHHQRKVLALLKPGDVLLRKYDHYLGSRFIPGYWSHAAIYIGNDSVIHALGIGVVEEDILTFMRCDDIAILRQNDTKLIDMSLFRADEQLGKEYDFDFDKSGPEKFYCTELVNFCFIYPKFSKELGKIIYPDDLLHSIWYVIWGGRRYENIGD